MLTDVGFYAVILALLVLVYAAGSSVLGARRNDDRLVQSGRTAASLAFPLMLIGAAGIWAALLNNDYGVKYVASVSSRATPLFFRLTALWGAQDGSLLFWCLLMSIFVFFAMRRPWREDKSLLPYVTATMALVLAFFIGLTLVSANPFARFDFPPPDGRGLNPLLRHPGMIIHPPVLYAGFTGFIVPFAFCMASLITRRSDDLWLRSSRRWTLVGWVFLTCGLVLGGRWAHDVLGWGGYWGWDPVENKSLVPWLLGTAFLHSAMIQEKRGMFKNWNVALMMLTFGSIVWATAIVRSGVLTSVHAFAQSSMGPIFLGFLVLMLSGMLYFWLTRLDVLKSDNQLDRMFSREGIFLIQNVVFVSSAITVFALTSLPIATEAFSGQRLTVGPPYFNAVVVPQFFVLVVLMGIAPLMAWARANGKTVARQSRAGLFAAALVAALWFVTFTLRDMSFWTVVAALLVGLCAYSLAITLMEFARGTRARMTANRENAPTALARLFGRNQRRYGGYFIHLGVVVLAIGAIGKGFFGGDAIRNVALNDTFTYRGYAFTYRGLQTVPCEFNDCLTLQAALKVTRAEAAPPFAQAGDFVGAIYPHVDRYEVQQFTSTIADITGSFNEEVYVILSAWEDEGASATFTVYINPLINWVWLGGVLMVVGFFLAFWRTAPETVARPVLAPAAGVAGK
ncbi:MAG TPA: heme lyase CcmF/NrfE family subunit [Thermoflexales bacterium]|nr:heme lyase CcmF/NrfE family subunit [Thermoflexales bacterium]